MIRSSQHQWRVSREFNWLSLTRFMPQADYLTLHVGLTPQTGGMINEKSLAKMKKGVRIINCARGELLDEAAVAAALASKQVGGIALDVFTEEPPKNSPLLALENVIATPHIAGSTNEAQDAVGVQIASQVREYLKRGVIQNAVNMPSIDHQQYTQMQPYIALAEKLGAFLANIVPACGIDSGNFHPLYRTDCRVEYGTDPQCRNPGSAEPACCRAGQRGERSGHCAGARNTGP